MSIRNKETRAVSEVLNQVDPDKRLTVYHAFGYFLCNHVTNGAADPLIVINRVLNRVNELAILDKAMIKRIVLNYHNFYNTNNSTAHTVTATNMFDVLNIEQTIGIKNIEIINANFTLFKTALASYHGIKLSLIEDED